MSRKEIDKSIKLVLAGVEAASQSMLEAAKKFDKVYREKIDIILKAYAETKSAKKDTGPTITPTDEKKTGPTKGPRR